MAGKDFDIILFYSLKAGNNDALELLFNKYYSQLCNYVHSFINDAVLSEDVVTDLFADIWLKRSKIEIEKNFRSYLYKSAKNAALAHIRKRKLNEVSIEEIQDINIHSSQNPFAKYDNEQLDLGIQTIMKKIPPRSREVFILHRFEGLKYKEIAEQLNISVKTVENNMGTALKKVYENRDLLKKLVYILVVFSEIFHCYFC